MTAAQRKLGLTIYNWATVFVILVTSLIGTFFPVFGQADSGLAQCHPWCRLRVCQVGHCHVDCRLCTDSTRFFGSGVITATDLIHLLEPAADDELGPANTTIALRGCISNDWADYPYA